MLKMLNAALVGAVLVSAYFLYAQEHATRKLERTIAKVDRQMNEEREKIKLLDAEWAALNRPERIQKIAEEELHLKVLQPQQFVPLAEMATRLPQSQPLKLEAQNKDEIGAMLEKMQ
jgi:cell division protein FtsL